jgi:hypothetical protein
MGVVGYSSVGRRTFHASVSCQRLAQGGPWETTLRPTAEIKLEVAKCLLADASVFQHADVTSRIALVGFLVAADHLSSVLPSSSMGSRAVELRRLVPTPLGKAIWRRSCHDELPQLVQSCNKIDFVLSADVIPKLVSALGPILIVNGIPCCTSSDVDALDALDFP